MRTTLTNNEQMLKQGAANLQRGIETVGGKLYLTNERLIFEPHLINIQKQTEIINLKDIDTINKVWTKYLNIIPLFPNSINIKVKNGNEFNFVLWFRNKWISSISKAKQQI